jgi:hypothetical protein
MITIPVYLLFGTMAVIFLFASVIIILNVIKIESNWKELKKIKAEDKRQLQADKCWQTAPPSGVLCEQT